MIRRLVIFLLGAIVGLGGGFALGIFFYPFIFLADIAGADLVPDAASRQVLARGTFIHANRADPVHYGKGRLTIYRGLLHLEQDFEVGPGPKYHVYLVPEANVTPSFDVPKSGFVDLGRLRAFKGSQNYAIPGGVDLAKFGSVVIWCEFFGVLISPAKLAPEKRGVERGS